MSRVHDNGRKDGHGRARSPRTWAALVPAVVVSAVLTACDGSGSAGSDGPDVSGGPAGAGSDTSVVIPDRTPAPSPTEETPDTAPADELRTALERLLAGESSPGAEGTTWFSAKTAGALRSVAVDPGGHATVDFADLRPLIPNASSSAGSTALLRELNAAVFGVDGIRSVEYRMEGSCDLFWEWLQYGCRTVTRADSGVAGP